MSKSVQSGSIVLWLVWLPLVFWPCVCLGQSAPVVQETTALDEYVSAADEAYDWTVVERKETGGLTRVTIDLVSQAWRQPQEVDRPVWHHWLTLYVPRQVEHGTALLFIGGGDNSQEMPTDSNGMLLRLARATNSVVAELRTVPNQPLVFNGDGRGRSEDAILAFTWEQYLKTGDSTWLGQLPMTKSAVRALDAIQEVVAQEKLAPEIADFVVTGGSKRGWTTWLTAAVDYRVKAILPLVIDVLNIADSIPHHHAVYGFWAPTLRDYVRHGLPDRLDDPECRTLLSIVDPYCYRERLRMPKCIINASGDQFFVPDSSRFYFDDLEGEKYLCYVPNTGHSLRESTASDTLTAFYFAILNAVRIPQLGWEETAPGHWKLTTDMKPTQVLRWQAVNQQARDFRIDSIGPAYQAEELPPDHRGNYAVECRKPEQGWAATFVEFTYEIGAPTPLRLTTPVWITPDTLPATGRSTAAQGSQAGPTSPRSTGTGDLRSTGSEEMPARSGIPSVLPAK